MKKRLNKLKLLILCVIPAVVLLGLFLFFKQAGFNVDSSDGYQDEDINHGVEKLKEFEKKDIVAIQNDIDSVKSPESTKKEEKTKDGKKDYAKIFEGSVVMGDSRSEGFDQYGFLNKMSVVAKKGISANKAKDLVGSVVSLAPKNLFINYGMNDLESFNADKFKSNYEDLIKEFKSKLPNTKIYMVSIFPTMQKAIDKQPRLNNLNQFNDVIKDICKENNVTYIDATNLIKGKTELYEPDGIHFKAKFYPVWLDYLAQKAKL